MHGELLLTRRIRCSAARIIEDISTISAFSAEPEIIDVRTTTGLKDRNELVMRAVEASLAGIRLPPYQQILPFRVLRECRLEQVGQMSPIDKPKIYRAILAERDGLSYRPAQKGSEFDVRHLARALHEFSVLDFRPATRMPIHRNVVRRVSHNHFGFDIAEKRGESRRGRRIAANQTVLPQLPDVTYFG